MISSATLNELQDGELRVLIEQCQSLLKRRDEDRKAKVIEQARELLASVGLTPKDLSGKSRMRGAKDTVYHGGHHYQHPANRALVWNAKGQKPTWLRELERGGGKAIEVSPEPANDNTAIALKKTG